MKVVIKKEYEVNGCVDCPYAQAYANFDSYDEDDYRCEATPDKKFIAGFVFVKEDLRGVLPDWCPLIQRKEI